MHRIANRQSRLPPQLRLLPMIVLLAGCGMSGPQLAPVSGRVTLGGKPLALADVVFQPDGARPPSYGRTDKDGHYELAYKRGVMGALVGEHSVSISVSRELVRNPPRIAQSQLRREVKPGRNEFDFNVKTEEK